MKLPARIGMVALFVTIGMFGFLGFCPPLVLDPDIEELNLPTRRQLYHNFSEVRQLHVVYPGEGRPHAGVYDSLYSNVESGWYQITGYKDSDYSAGMIGSTPLQVVGALASNRIVTNLLHGLPVERVKHGFKFHNRVYRDSSAVLSLFYPNPLNPSQQLRLITGNRDGAILSFLKDARANRRTAGDYLISQNGKTVVVGFFDDQGRQAWQPAGAIEYRNQPDGRALYLSEHFRLVSQSDAIGEEELKAFGSRQEQRLLAALQKLEMSRTVLNPEQRLTVNLWDNFEAKGLLTGRSELRHFDAQQNAVHLIWTEQIKGDDFLAEAQWLVEKVMPQTASVALQEGLAVALSSEWRGSGFEGWAAKLITTGNAVPIEELFEPHIWQAESPLVRRPLLGALVDYLLRRYDVEQFLDLYRNWPKTGVLNIFPDNTLWEEIKASCHAELTSSPTQLAPRNKRDWGGFHKGFCYAHEGYRVFDGYMGSRSQKSIAKMSELGVNAISVTPFGYLRDPHQPDFLIRSDGVRQENDESLLAAMLWAREHGMHVMLKPHVLMARPNWGWPGEVVMKSESDWALFFDRYERWIRHYAMLAEIYRFDSFCAGVELVQTTIGHQKQWRQILRNVREIYSGPVIYAANWGEEFENLTFWNEIDGIGINCYYPLSTTEVVTDKELLQGANRIADKIEQTAKRFGKKVLITEIGFSSRPTVWQQPHLGPRRAQVDLIAQKRCYDAIFQAFWHREWLGGIYWWKWPTYLDDGGPEDNQFTPNGKPAAEVVARWYRDADAGVMPGR